jgi:hypothetical protein
VVSLRQMLILWLGLAGCVSAEAAFRVYQLKIVNFDSSNRVETQQTVLTTLDPWQYENYYAGYRWMTIRMVDTWYCPGDTSRRVYCAKPKVKNRAPASSVPGQRVELPYNRQPIIP